MKTILVLFVPLLMSVNLKGADLPERTFHPDSLVLINEEIHLYSCGDFFFGGWPPEEALQYLKSEGVEHIINLRSAKEMESFTKEQYSEDSLCEELGMTYHHLPIAGKEGYSPENLEAFAKIMSANTGKVFIHCYSGYRVTYLMMAWLIQERLFSYDEVVEFGKLMHYFSPLEGFLGQELVLRESL